MANLLKKLFGQAKQESIKEADTKCGGIVGFYDLSDWYENLSEEEKILLQEASQKGYFVGLTEDNLLTGDKLTEGCFLSNQTRSGWLNVMAGNIQRKNPDFAEKILLKSIIDNEAIDIYFALGLKAKILWRQNKENEAINAANQQLDWYRDKRHRLDLKQKICCLPKAIDGLDVLISAHEPEQSLRLVCEFVPLLDSNNVYKNRINFLETQVLCAKGEKALERGDKQIAIAFFEQALAKNPHAGVKGILKKIKSS